MALLIDRTTNVLGNIQIPQVYIRLLVGYGPAGSPLSVELKPYSSKESYESGENNTFELDGVQLFRNFSYDRDIDGIDILLIAHDKVKEALSTDIIENLPVLDPSTGNPQYDSSTGELITEPVITVPKFAQDSSISVVDISIG